MLHLSMSQKRQNYYMINKIKKILILFLTGGSIYYLIEYFYKMFISHGITHWSMFLLGGICFILIGGINEYIPWDMCIIKQGLIGTLIILTLEFIFGYILNIILQLNIWDYSNLPFNILGQICLPFAVIWFGLSLIAIFLDDFLRWKLFNEEKPHYTL